MYRVVCCVHYSNSNSKSFKNNQPNYMLDIKTVIYCYELNN